MHMKTHQKPKRLRGFTAALGGFAWFSGALHGAPFLYTSGDLVLAFRQAGNASDLVVKLGKASQFSTLPVGSTLVVSNLADAQISAAFPSVNGLNWSVAGAIRTPGDPVYPFQTLWVTAPRDDATVQSPPWLRKGSFVQGTVASQIDSVGNNAAASSSSQATGANNTATAVVIPVNTDFAFSPLIGDAGDYAGTFQGRVESTTPADFDGATNEISRADLYELIPGSSADGTLNAPGRYLGYFELKPDGTLTFNTGTPAPAWPTISAIVRAGDITSVSFNSASNLAYRLRATDAAGLTAPVSSWTTGVSIIGTGLVLTLQNTNSASIQFFAVEVQP